MEELEVNHVAEIQEKLTEMVGDRVKVKANMGRTRVIERMGVIKNVHPAVFIVEVLSLIHISEPTRHAQI